MKAWSVLTRGFMYGGAERVMASVWNVNDSVTAQFMKRFYEGVFGEGVDTGRGARAAQVGDVARGSRRDRHTTGRPSCFRESGGEGFLAGSLPR